MTDFVVTITDPAQLAGITWAREQHNASLPPPPPPPDPPADDPEAMAADDATPTPMEEPVIDPNSLPIETDAAYVQWVMEQAAASYAVQQEQAAWIAAYNDSQAAGTRGVTPPSFVKR